MRRLFFIILILSVGLICLQCSKSTEPEEQDPPVYRMPADLTVAEKSLVESANRFSFKLFREIALGEDPDSNIFISPLSVSYALGMTYNGAAGETREAMAQTLELAGLSVEEINKSYQGLTDILIHLDPSVTMNIANSIWYREGEAVIPEFIALNQTYFDALIREINFNLPETVDTINAWVNEKTNGRIEEIIKPPIDRGAVMYLINAIYFKGNWTEPFDPEDNFDTVFYLPDGSETDCTIMYKDTNLYYCENGYFQAVDLPYGDQAFSMTLFLPKPPYTVDSIAELLTEDNWESWINGFAGLRVQLGMPKFKFSYDAALNKVLKTLGMEIAFDPGKADFTNMIEDGGIWIDSVLHKTFIQVDEEGTEAAAVTLVEMIRALPRIIVNRSFLFVIREHESGTILFMGKIVNPVWRD